MARYIWAVPIAVLAGCSTIGYHADRPVTESALSASYHCHLEETDNNSGVMLAALPFGVIGGAFAGAVVGAQKSPAQQREDFERCMSDHGWVK